MDKEETMRRSVHPLLAVVILVVLIVGAACAPAAEPKEELVIGAALALTGANAPFDAPFKEGLEVAVAKINEGGGIDGKIPVRLDIRDIKSDAALAAQVAQELVSSGVDVLITGADTDYSIAGGLAAKRGGIPAIASVATTPTIISAVGDNMFLASMGDNTQSAALAEYAIGEGYGTAYTLGSPDSAYTQKVIEYFTSAYTDLGGEVALADTFSVGATDFAPQIAKIQALGEAPDVIVTSAWVPDSAIFVKQLRASGIDIPVLSTDGNDSPLLTEVGGDAVEGMVFSTHGFLEPGSALETFYADYETIKGEPPESIFAALGADLAAAVAAAVTKAGSTEPGAIRDALASLEGVQGATGKMTYAGQTGVPLKDVALVVVEGGAFKLLRAFQPSSVPPP
jgi:branched-chain amino acid transport system substrate-binding protein